jgi:hypothetical protein
MEPVLYRIGLPGEPRGRSEQAACKARRHDMQPLVLAADPLDEV